MFGTGHSITLRKNVLAAMRRVQSVLDDEKTPREMKGILEEVSITPYSGERRFLISFFTDQDFEDAQAKGLERPEIARRKEAWVDEAGVTLTDKKGTVVRS